MEQRNRLPNRLPSFDYAEAHCYFVTQCTHNRQNLFSLESVSVGNDPCVVPYSVANQVIHKWIAKPPQKYPNVKVDQYVLMPDHIHLIVSIQESCGGCSLPTVMQFFKTMTTNEYIQCVKSGILPAFEKKIWQKSYYDHVIRNQQDYLETWEYIQNNPIRWMEKYSQQG